MIRFIVRAIRKLYFQIAKNFRSTITVRSEYGIFKVFTQDRVIGYTLFKDRKWEIDSPHEIFAFLMTSSLLAERITLLDFGANIGITSIPFVRFGWVENAVAIEADPDNFRLLRENVWANYLANRIFPIHAAVTEAPAEIAFEKSIDNFGDHRVRSTGVRGSYREHLRRVTMVRGDSLQNLVSQTPVVLEKGRVLMWVDIQGHEGYCFRGAQAWLKALGVVAVCEIWPYGILRSGMSLEEFSAIVAAIWKGYFVWRQGRFVYSDTSAFPALLETLTGDQHENIILVP
jgi:FkbM family methyltransferase